MKTELVDLNQTRKQLLIEIPAEKVDQEIARATSRYGKQARLPGFRPGKIPTKLLRQRFKQEIMHDVAHHLVEHAMADALAERGVAPVDTPNVRDVKLEEGQPLTFRAEFDVLPTFDPGDFSTIDVRRAKAVVEDEAVSRALEQLRERAARFEPVEEERVGPGHTVTVDLERQGFDKEGQAGEKTSHERVPVEIGSAANPPGFDEALIGLQSGETKAFRLRFPDDYSVTDLAGTEVAYQVKVHDLRQRVMPTLDDEFAKDVGDFESLEALRTRVRTDLEAEAKQSAERQARADVLRQLAARVPFPVPQSLIDREVDRRLEEFAHRLADQRVDLRKANIDWGAFRQAQEEPAKEAVASALVLDEVTRREDVGVSELEIDAELSRYSARSGLTVDVMRERLEQDGSLERLVAGLRREKTLGRIMEQVRVVEV